MYTHIDYSDQGFETKDIPHGYAPAAAPFSDRTGTQLEDEEKTPAQAKTSRKTSASSASSAEK